MTKGNALQSLWESKHQQLKALAGTGERPQQIYTPECIIERLESIWPDGIELDPCSGPDSIVPAHRVFNEEDDGLAQSWSVSTVYVNPPYKHLKQWLAKARAEYRPNENEIVLLIPVRPHRKWWRDFVRYSTDVIYLNPLKFVGYEQAFPAPLCLVSLGCHMSDVFDDLGGRI